MTKRRRKPLVCSIGSTDPTCAAGIGLDLRIFERLGARACLAVAAVTAQNDSGVTAIVALEPETIIAQLHAIWAQEVPDALRIGLLPNAHGTRSVIHFLRELTARPPIVMDPVIAASSGTQFCGPDEIAALRALMPLVDVITPNANEAQMFSGMRVSNLIEARGAAAHLSELGCAVLLKGGHLSGARSVDVLARNGRVVKEFGSRKLRATMRGSGCTLAAVLAVELAKGYKLERAIARARAFVLDEIRSAKRQI